MHRLPWIAWGLMTYLALLTAVGSYNYVYGDPKAFGPYFHDKYVAHLGLVRTHAVGAVLALALGPFQFWPWLRTRARHLHRIAGLVYLAGIVLAAPSGLAMGLMAYGGMPAQIGFSIMAVLWLASAAAAYRAARGRRFRQHERYMVRNYALTFGAVLVRLYLALAMRAGLSFEAVYPFISWLSWVPTLLVAELMFNARSGALSSGGERRNHDL
ncbi:MAG: DUF2306 domain-containing protein [Vulcanimicrobiota bacterium]